MRAIQHVIDRNRMRNVRRRETHRVIDQTSIEGQRLDPRLLSQAARLDRGGASTNRIAAELGVSHALARHLQLTSRDQGEERPTAVLG